MAEYGNNVLLELDTIIDLDYGIIKLIRQKYNNLEYMKDYMLNADEYFTKCMILSRKDPNPVTIMLQDKYLDNANSIYEDMLEQDMDTILELTPPTNIFGLLQTYRKTDGIIKCTILCKNVREEQYIKSIDPSLNVIVGDHSVDLTIYDSIFIKNYRDTLKYNKLNRLEGKSLFISRYDFNLQPERDEDTVLFDVSVFIADVNKVYLVTPYTNFKFPEKIKV